MDEDRRDFEAWYRDHWPRLVGALTVVTRDPEVAADVCAEALSRLWVRWDGGRVADPAAWTYRVAVNVAKRRARRADLEHALLRRHCIEAVVAAHEPVGEVWAAVAALPHRQRAAVALRYLADLTQPQVAAALGISTGAVASTLHDARRRLADALGHDPLDERTDQQPTHPTTDPKGTSHVHAR